MYDRWPIPFVLQAWATGAAIAFLNAIRTLGAHRYDLQGENTTFVGQLLDSLNFPSRPWITELWGPVGTRFHALHHLFPSMPYHNFPRAHALLMEYLPSDSEYRTTVRHSLWAAVAELVVQIWNNRGQESGGALSPEGASTVPGQSR